MYWATDDMKSGNKQLNFNKETAHTSLLSISCWQFGQGLVGLLFHIIVLGSHVPDAHFILVAILLLSTNHEGLHNQGHSQDKMLIIWLWQHNCIKPLCGFKHLINIRTQHMLLVPFKFRKNKQILVHDLFIPTWWS